MIGKYLNPKNDKAFKKIFGNEKDQTILIHFLNDVLDRSTNPITHITMLKTSQEPAIAAQRASSVDVMCQDSTGAYFIVEMQVAQESGFIKRAQYYAAKTYIEQRKTNTTYADLKEVIFIAITDYTLFKKHDSYISRHVMLEELTHEHHLKDFSFTFIELPKFKKKIGELTSMTEKWCYFLKHAADTQEKDLPLIVGEDAIIGKAYEELNRFSWSLEEIREYDSAEMKQLAAMDILETAQRIGREQGLEQGKLEGLEQGLKRGKIEIARSMLQDKEPIEKIIKWTGLGKEDLERLI